jgi:type IV pilus assembly protein PilO
MVFCAILLGAGWYFDTQEQQIQLEKVIKMETELKTAFEIKQKKAANLAALEKQMEDMAQTFGEMLKRLPGKTEVAALLVDISQQGLASGLEFELFKPGVEAPADFYVELPIRIRVTGSYHQFGEFVSGVADLPRIVTQHDIQITRGTGAGKESGSTLVMETTAKTYRYQDEDEEQGK